MSRLRVVVALVAVPLLTTGCALLGGDDADAGDAEEALTGQRDAVAATARTLVDEVTAVLGGEVLETQGRWDGCTSRFPEGYEDFHYHAAVRLQAEPGTPERVVGDLRRIAGAVAESGGLTVEEVDEDAVRVSDGDVTAVLKDIPDLGAEGDVLIELTAEPCVEVPGASWEDWLRRDDPGPALD